MKRHYIQSIRVYDKIETDSFLNELPIVKYLNIYKYLSFDFDVTFLVGENGTGKSTLIEALAYGSGYNEEGGSKDFFQNTFNTISDLHKYIKIAKSAHERDGFFLRAESFYNIATIIDTQRFGYSGKELHKQSHGESFIALIENKFKGNGLYILDEPEAALSPLRQLTLISEINRLVKMNSQFIIATHSPYLLAYPNAHIYQLTESGIDEVEYDECEHVRLAKLFLENPNRIIKHLI